ncbi:MAG: DUF503 domain-containing protein [Candidatus Marinimicrobia bacterium]|nr:DUF503 domain-containing protein [Candidatus Neomarinimicrobiota bacterium]
MHIILLRAHIDIPGAHSLKEKRRVVKSLKESTVARMNVSVAEVGQHEVWNRAELAFITVAAESDVVEKRVSKIIHRLETGSDWILLEVKTEKL